MDRHSIRPRALLALLAAVGAAVLGLALVLGVRLSPAVAAGACGYPDLRTLTPTELRLDALSVAGSVRHVLRFSNTVHNAGAGRLELHGQPTGTSNVDQWIFDDAGALCTNPVTVGQDFTFHESHNHWHFEGFAEYELWTRAEFDAWIASGRRNGQAQRRGAKTTFCIMDIERISGTAPSFYSSCGSQVQGLSVGWGDTYRYSLPEQWIEVGATPLADGAYVLRSVADPQNKLHESADRADPARESAQANEALAYFTVRRGRLRSRD